MIFQEFQASAKLVQCVEEMKALSKKLQHTTEEDYYLIDFHVYVNKYIIEYSRTTNDYALNLDNQDHVSEELSVLEEKLFNNLNKGENAVNVIFSELNLNLDDMLQLSSFCADNITENSWGIETALTIYRGDDADHKDGILQSLDVTISGAEEFDLLEEYVSGLLAMHLEHGLDPVLRVKVKGYSIEQTLLEVNEENLRKEFDSVFSQLEECRSSGSIYIGDNGTYLLEFLDITEKEKNMIITWFTERFKNIQLTKRFFGRTLLLHIC